MSLYERAQKTSNPNLTKGQIASLNYVKKNKNSSLLTLLHKQVQEIISPDKLAEYMSTNPQRAKSEIYSAAYRCFLNVN